MPTYLIPTSLDAPRIETILVEAPFEDAPHGAKGVGELPMDVGAPAVIAAIHDAIGTSGSTTCPRRRSGSWPPWRDFEPPGPPGVSAVSPAAPGEAAA